MTTARDEVLGRIRQALCDVPATQRPEELPIERAYLRTGEATRAELVERFAQRLAEYQAGVRRISPRELPQTIAAACAAREVRQLVVPADLPLEWLGALEQTTAPAGYHERSSPALPEDQAHGAIALLRDPGLSNQQLDQSDGVLTGCELAIAQTGTIVLDCGARQGRRALTLLPDYHLCVVYAGQIVELVPEAIGRLIARPGATRRPLTLISGPSATSDIELRRVEGVHGPRSLEVLIVEGQWRGAAPSRPDRR